MLLALAVTLLGIAKIIKIEDAMEATITKFWKLRDINIMDRLNPARRLCKIYCFQNVRNSIQRVFRLRLISHHPIEHQIKQNRMKHENNENNKLYDFV